MVLVEKSLHAPRSRLKIYYKIEQIRERWLAVVQHLENIMSTDKRISGNFPRFLDTLLNTRALLGRNTKYRYLYSCCELQQCPGETENRYTTAAKRAVGGRSRLRVCIYRSQGESHWLFFEWNNLLFTKENKLGKECIGQHLNKGGREIRLRGDGDWHKKSFLWQINEQ